MNNQLVIISHNDYNKSQLEQAICQSFYAILCCDELHKMLTNIIQSSDNEHVNLDRIRNSVNDVANFKNDMQHHFTNAFAEFELNNTNTTGYEELIEMTHQSNTIISLYNDMCNGEF